MKKYFCLYFAIILAFTISACGETGNGSSEPETSLLANSDSLVAASTDIQSVAKPQSSSSKKQTTTSSADPISYNEITCRAIADSQWQAVRIKDTQTNITLRLEIPSDWSLSPAGDRSFNIIRSGRIIGGITTSELARPKESFDKHWLSGNGIDISRQIDLHIQNGKNSYHRYYEFTSPDKSSDYLMKMWVGYSELDADAADRVMYRSATILEQKAFVHPSKTNGAKEILILGNSFINTSQIGAFLNDMLTAEQVEYSVNAISRGMADVGIFANDASICEAISQGKYCYVFICGFYSYDTVEELLPIKNLCDATQTQLVIFPAHNEAKPVIESAVDTYKDIRLLNWKEELDSLIDYGVPADDLCMNDGFKHSKPLAGYVGAHMIYRSIFGIRPPDPGSNLPLTSDYINSKLREYIQNGGELNPFNGNTYEIN